jgi:hypothetical protein
VLRLRSADALRLHEQTDSRHRVDQGLPPLTERALSSRLFGAYTSGGKLRHAQCHRHGLGPDCRTVRRAGAGGTLARSRRKLLSFLDKHADIKPRVALRYTIEHLDKGLRSH